MTYQGERARPMATESGRFFEVQKLRIGADGHVSEVLWAEVNTAADRDLSPRVRASAAEVVDAIHDGAQVAAVFSPSAAHPLQDRPDRAFVIVEHADGRECIAFDDALSPGRQLGDVDSLDA